MNDMAKIAAERFAADRFAIEAAGIVPVEVGENYARCRMEIKPVHLNALGQVMGGALYTLADFAFAIAANGAELTTPTVTLSASMEYLRAVKGSFVEAETVCLKAGRSTCVMEVNITDEAGKLAAKATLTGYRLGGKD